MSPEKTSIMASLGALLVALGWTLVRRIKRAKRILPRGRFRLLLSLRTPSSTPPDSSHTIESDPPVELTDADLEIDDRDTTRPPKRARKAHERRRKP